MSALVEKLRAADGGVIERGESVEYVIGHPHPLWKEMVDVIDAAAKMEWRLRRKLPLWTARRRLEASLLALTEKLEKP